MRGIGYALIVVGVIGAVLVFTYPTVLNWSGLIGAIASILAGAGFASIRDDDGCCKKNNTSCSCNYNR